MSTKTFTPEVKHTSNYAQFKLMPGNRPISEHHVRRLTESYNNNPNLVELRPVLVNEKMEIVDGQHRLRACEKTSIEVPYIIAPGLTVATAQIMNALQKSWQMIDFARSYAYAGNVHYQKFEHYMDEYSLTPTIILLYIVGNRSKRNDRFKLGLFEMPSDLTDTDDRFGKLSSFADFPGISWQGDRFAKAFHSVLGLPGYDHSRMLRNMALALPTVKPQPDRLEWLRELERVYNYNIKTEANTLRFF